MAFCLHLGNVDFVNNPKDDNAMVDPKTAEHLKNAAEMLRKSPEELETALVRNTIHVINKDGTVGRTYPQTFNAEQAVIQRHTLARNIYNDLFMQHIKEKIQKSLIGTARFDNNDPSSNAKICILDIFGFEFTPDKKLLSDNPKEGMPIMRNSLEQFCINWCNEALQDKFIRCVVDAEELFYDDQLGAPLGLDTSELDNKQTLKMIQGNDGWAIAKKLRDGGNMFKKDNRQTAEMKLIKKLQEEQGDPSNHDRVGRPILTFPDALNTSWKGKLRISTYLRDRKKKNPEAYPDIDDGHIFALKHYAGVVTYSMLDWLAKDANSVSDNMKEFLANSQAHPDRDNAWTPEYYQSRLYEKEASLITAAFKANMKDLIEGQLDKCYCWFTRCIKPCNKQRSEMMPPFDIAKKYEGYKVLDQLRYTGMLDALTIRKIGFSARLPHQEFALKYKLLCADLKPAPGPDDHQMIVDWILKQPWYKEVESPYAQADPSHPDIMVGNSKAGRESFVLMRDTLAQHLDSERENKLFKSGILIRYEWKAMHYGQEWKAKYKACVGGGKYKDEANCGPHPVNDVAYKPEHPLGLNSALRGILQRLQYYKDKHRYLQLKSRSNLAPLVRAQIKRNEYLKKRNARFEETNREMVQNWLRGTACRQGYYEAKLQFLEKEQMEAERAKMSQQEEFGREFMLDLEEERKMEEEERFNMEAEELYRNAILDALFLGTLNSNKERIFMGASEALCRAQAAYRRLKDAESAEGDLEQQVEANAEEIERGAHLKVQELLLSHIPKTLEQFGTCNQVRAPDTDNYQLTADELEAFPMDKVSDLGAVRRHVFATNPAYRDMNPAGPPKKKNEEELDEGFTFEKPKEPEPPEPVAATGQEPEASTDATTDATKALPEETKAPEPVQTNFSSGIELQLSVDPSSLNDAQKRKLIVEMSKIVGCDPSQLHVR